MRVNIYSPIMRKCGKNFELQGLVYRLLVKCFASLNGAYDTVFKIYSWPLQVILCLFVIILAGCSNEIHPSPAKNSLNERGFEEFTSPIFEEEAYVLPAEEIEEVTKYPKDFYNPVSLCITSEAPIKDVILKLARQAKVSVSIAHDVSTGASINSSDRPFIDLIEDICSACDLKYLISGKSLRIENDVPYLKTYSMQFLNLARETQASISTATDMGGMNSATSSSDKNSDVFKDNGSSSSVTASTKTEFWTELEAVLKTILNNSKGTEVTIHRQGGIIAVIATEKQHKMIKEYLRILKENTESQVLIEAKILEISLLDEYRGGINWASAVDSNFVLDIKSPDLISNSNQSSVFSLGSKRRDFSAILKFIERFGAIKTLSNPRITVMNNQSAILKVARNEVIPRASIHRQFSSQLDSRNSDTISTDIQTIPIGLVFTVQPAIDMKKGEVTLTLRPTISRVVRFCKIPNYAYIANPRGQVLDQNHQTAEVPVVEVRELDSVLKVRSGEVVVLGGLMQEKERNERVGIPGTKDIKGLNHLFNARSNDIEFTELVIFLKVKIVGNSKRAGAADLRLLHKYTNDPRPFDRAIEGNVENVKR